MTKGNEEPAGYYWVAGIGAYLLAVGAFSVFVVVRYGYLCGFGESCGEDPGSFADINEGRLIAVVLGMGAIGATIHAVTSLVDFTGNQVLHINWIPWLLFRPLVGALLALVFFFVLRVGFVAPPGQDGALNPYAIAAFAGLVGLFSRQAVDKLGEVFDTLFRSDRNEQRGGKPKPAPVIESISPASVKHGTPSLLITVTAKNIDKDSEIVVAGHKRATQFAAPSQLTTTLAASDLAAPSNILIAVRGKGGDSQPVAFTVS